MLSCQDVSQLLCESLDHKLPLGKYISLRIHLMFCVMCRRNAQQLKAMHTSLSKACEEMPDVKLSDTAKQKFKQYLKNA